MSDRFSFANATDRSILVVGGKYFFGSRNTECFKLVFDMRNTGCYFVAQFLTATASVCCRHFITFVGNLTCIAERRLTNTIRWYKWHTHQNILRFFIVIVGSQQYPVVHQCEIQTYVCLRGNFPLDCGISNSILRHRCKRYTVKCGRANTAYRCVKLIIWYFIVS